MASPKLVSAANKAMHAMNRRCAFVHISDPKRRCKLFDNLVLPILSCTCEVWAVEKEVGESAEQLQMRQSYRSVAMCHCGDTANKLQMRQLPTK